MYSLYEMDDERALHMTRIEEGRIGYYARFAAIPWKRGTMKLSLVEERKKRLLADEIFVIDLPNFLSVSRAIRKPHDSISFAPSLILFLSSRRIRNKAEETCGKRNIASDVKISRERFSIPRPRNKKTRHREKSHDVEIRNIYFLDSFTQ